MPFSFTLSDAASTSAGVFAADGSLVNTLWSGVRYGAGAHSCTWDGLDDEGNLVANGNYTVKVVSNNVNYEWEGVIGNTSQAKTGSTINRAAQGITSMVVVGKYAYYAVAYTEGNAASYLKFDTSNPQVRLKIHPQDGQSTYVVASDGTYVYWAGAHDAENNFITATRVDNDTDVPFDNGTNISAGNYTYSAINVVKNSQIMGLAVQKVGNYLLAAHSTTNQIRVLNKKTGAFLRSWSVNKPMQIALADDNSLWIIHDNNVVEKFTLNNMGVGTATGIKLPNLLAPVAVAVSPDGQTVMTIDGSFDNRVTTAGNHQVKAYNARTGAQIWSLGQAGGYASDPTVANDKFCFINTKTFEGTDSGQAQPYLAFQPNGSFWVGDVGNLRSQHFSASRTYLDQLAYIGYFYSCVADPNAPKRVFANYLEFEVDYTKPLSPSNGSWRLAKNWSYGRQAQCDDDYSRFRCLATLSNGRTYALALDHVTYKWEVIELPPTGNIRYTGVKTTTSAAQMSSDGSLWSIGDNRIGQPAVWKKQPLIGFDNNNNPQWGTEVVMATTPPVTETDPLTTDGYIKRNQLTSTGVIVAFCSDRPKGTATRGRGYHLGGVQIGKSNWLWKTSPSTTPDYRGDFPTDGTYDIGNGVEYAGTFAQAVDRSIFWGYNGEFWKNAQTNKWNHYLDNGLFIGQFGAVCRSDVAHEEAPYGMASNAVAGTFVKVGNDYYLYHCDEGFHAGIHRWKISGLSTIQEQTVANLKVVGTVGVLRQQFIGEDLNNFNLTSSIVTTMVKTDGQRNSTRWTGFISPTYSQTYTFYASVNQKVRLWVENKLLIDQWSNDGQAEFVSTPITLEFGKKYAISMEISGGAASLFWASPSQAKQLVPPASLYTSIISDNVNGLSLSEGLAYNSSVEQGLYGWTRSPTADYANPTDWWNKWLVKTNITTTSKSSPDVNIQFRPPASNLTAITSRNLGNSTTDLSEWSISGKITYPSGSLDKAGDQSYFQVLDEDDKVVARLARKEITWPADCRFYLNNHIIVQANIDSLYQMGKRAQPFTLTANSEGVTLQYADLPAITTVPLDPTSNWRRPKTLQVIFYSSVKSENELNMADLRFEANIMPILPTLSADDDQNTLSAWQSSSTWEIMVSEAGRVFVPYKDQILVGNVARPVGYWKFKLRNVVGSQESGVAESPVFKASTSSLPLTLIAFKADKVAEYIKISWSTVNEINTKSFVVERSSDGVLFTAINTVLAGNPTGNYSLVDKNLIIGMVYYRLKMIDTDTSFSYSTVVSVLDGGVELLLYPNPARDVLQLKYPTGSNSYLEVLSVFGKKMIHLDLSPTSTGTTLSIQSLPLGLYYLQYWSRETSMKKVFTKY